MELNELMKWSQVEEMAWWLAKFIYLVSFQGSQNNSKERRSYIFEHSSVSALHTNTHICIYGHSGRRKKITVITVPNHAAEFHILCECL